MRWNDCVFVRVGIICLFGCRLAWQAGVDAERVMVSDFFALEHHVLIKSATDLFLDNECARRIGHVTAGLGIARTRGKGQGTAGQRAAGTVVTAGLGIDRPGREGAGGRPVRSIVGLSSQLVQRTRHCRGRALHGSAGARSRSRVSRPPPSTHPFPTQPHSLPAIPSPTVCPSQI